MKSPTINDELHQILVFLPAPAPASSLRRGELAKVHHPDRGGDAAGFNRIKTAYDQAVKLARKTPA